MVKFVLLIPFDIRFDKNRLTCIPIPVKFVLLTPFGIQFYDFGNRFDKSRLTHTFSIQISRFCDFGKICLNNTNTFIRLSEYFHLLVLYCGNICTFLVRFLLKFRLFTAVIFVMKFTFLVRFFAEISSDCGKITRIY